MLIPLSDKAVSEHLLELHCYIWLEAMGLYETLNIVKTYGNFHVNTRG